MKSEEPVSQRHEKTTQIRKCKWKNHFQACLTAKLHVYISVNKGLLKKVTLMFGYNKAWQGKLQKFHAAAPITLQFLLEESINILQCWFLKALLGLGRVFHYHLLPPKASITCKKMLQRAGGWQLTVGKALTLCQSALHGPAAPLSWRTKWRVSLMIKRFG